MTKHILYIILLLCSFTVMAQNNAIFGGGNADGHDKDCYTQPSFLSVDFTGGNGDGHSKDCYQQTSFLSVSFAGGSGDGHSKDCYTQTPFLTVAFGGGDNDGHAQDCYTQQSNLNNIFSGGNGGDGMMNGCANEPLGCFLAINLGNDTTFCDGQTLTLDAGSFLGGATYFWQDSSTAQTFLVDTTGTYYVEVTDTAGCTGIDSIVVTVNPQPIVNLGNDTAFCAGNNLTLDAENIGANYQWQNGVTAPFLNQTFTASTTGQYFVNVAFGICTAVDTIEITVNPIVTTNLSDSIICQGDSSLIFGNYEMIAGTYRDTINASTGCDSILVQQLIVNLTYNQTLATVSICAGDSALILGNYELIAGVYADTLQSVNGCDSIVSQTLSVLSNSSVNLGNDTAFCVGNSLTLDAGAGATAYQWMNGATAQFLNQTYTVSTTGTYFVVVTNGTCSATDTINVILNPIITSNLSDSIICQGDSALIFGNYETIAGTYRDTLTSVVTGCDSILVQQLIVNPTYNQTLATVSICAGDSALILGNYELIAGVYADTLQSVNGCDSIVSQTLSVLSNSSVNLGNDTAFCVGNSLTLDAGAGATAYQWMNGVTALHLNQTYTVSTTGTYFVVVTNGTCSATDTINVILNPIITSNLSDSIICQGDSALIFGNYETIAGTYRDTLTSVVTGCDSILVQQLIVNPTYNQTLATVSICAGDSALILGNYELIAGVYADTLQSVNGCDSLVSQTLSVLSNSSVNLGNDTAFCVGNSLTLDAGAGATAYQWMNGVTALHLNQTFTVNITGTYFVVVTNGTCSASDTINVTINPIITSNLSDSIICQGDSALIFGNYETIAGTYRDTLTSVVTGCDSILVQQLIVTPTYNQTLATVSICAGDSALILGNYELIAGVYADTLQSVNGCDSIVSQTLIVDTLPIVNLGNDTAFCSGSNLTIDAGVGATAYQWMNGVTALHLNQTFTVNATGTYFVVVTNGTCSATDTINVIVNPIITSNLSDSIICQGDSALIFGNYETIAGTYRDTLTSVVTGCDSILVQQLIVNPTYNQTLATVSICAGDSALILGNYELIAGVYADTLQSINGCDSIVSQTLNVDIPLIVNLGNDTSICVGNSLVLDAGAGATYQWMNGGTGVFLNQTFAVNTTGTYFVVANVGACTTTDSINVTVIQPVFTTLTNMSICDNDSVSIFGNFQNTAGFYNDTLVSTIGCDSILIQQLFVNPNLTTNDIATICISDSIFLGGNFQNTAGTYYDTLQTIAGCDSLIATELFILNGFTTNIKDTICEGESIFVGGASQTFSGVYYDTLQTIGGCDSLIITTLLVTPIPTIIVTANPNVILAGQSSQLNVISSGTYSWFPGSSLTCTTCSNPTANPIVTTTYTITVDSNGCINSDTVMITVDDEFLIPEGFSPNGDGDNDVFEILGITNYPDNSITIMNRWGSKVFEASPYKGDWNGSSQFGFSFGDELPTGTYFYILDLGKNGPNGDQIIKGFIYLNK